MGQEQLARVLLGGQISLTVGIAAMFVALSLRLVRQFLLKIPEGKGISPQERVRVKVVRDGLRKRLDKLYHSCYVSGKRGVDLLPLTVQREFDKIQKLWFSLDSKRL